MPGFKPGNFFVGFCDKFFSCSTLKDNLCKQNVLLYIRGEAMVIYLDVLILINFYITYFVILAVSVLTHTAIPFIRKLIACLIGGMSSLVIFLPDDNGLISAGVKVLLCVVTSFVLFYPCKKSRLVTYFMFLLGTNFVFAGLMLCLWLFASPLNMLYNNGTVYFDIDILTLIISTVLSYFLLRVIRKALDKNHSADKKYCISVLKGNTTVSLTAMSDTGNSLTDYITGLPVIVCNKESCYDILPNSLKYNATDNTAIIKDKVRIIPFSTVGGEGMVYAFKADKIIVSENSDHESYIVNALIGISPHNIKEYDAVFNPKILV